MADETKVPNPSETLLPESRPEHLPGDFFPARVLLPEERAQAAPFDEAALMTMAKKCARDPAIFDEFPPLFFPAAVSTSKRDAYETAMHKTSLQNFATELSQGVSLQDSHDTSRLGIGYSLQGRYIGAGGNGVQQTIGDFYTAPITPDAAAFAQKLRAALVRDVSVGFYGGQWVCDLCGEDMMRGSCTHWPGQTYDVKGEMKLATATIHDAHLAEVSVCYDGATPGAMILRSHRLSEAGLIEPAMARRLEAQLRIQLPASHRAWAGASTPTEYVRAAVDARTSREEGSMPETPGQGGPPADTPTDPGILQAFHRSIADALKEVPLPPESRADEPATLIRRLGAELIELRPLRDKVGTLEARVIELEPQAADGVAFRADLRAAVEAEYVRALGARAKVELKAEVWNRASIALLKAEYEEYAGQAYRLLGGGRTSLDEGEPHPNGDGTHNFVVPAAPPSAFRA